MAEPSPMLMVQPSDENAVARSAQRKAAFRLIPIIGVGYCLAYMDRINISFASLQIIGICTSAVRSTVSVQGFLHRLCVVRSAFKSVATPFRRETLVGAHHVHLGPSRGADDVCAYAARVQRAASSCWAWPKQAFIRALSTT